MTSAVKPAALPSVKRSTAVPSESAPQRARSSVPVTRSSAEASAGPAADAEARDREEPARERRRAPRLLVEIDRGGGDVERLEPRPAEAAARGERRRKLEHALDRAVGTVARQAPAAPMRAPDVILGIDREPVGIAASRGNLREEPRRAELARGHVERIGVDPPLEGVGEIERAAVAAPADAVGHGEAD